ncbi:DUF3307 domain-containing protein [Hymenobacter fodinae]|uniref:DUF3307 domain-containing protein n=1 Tax=Hymenobacter fodinae TaxID=2510796 RepID=A0A4Z0P5L4_9BACT|nr:DUF3307 domain-containing protein [Hymenobacter fodinae]TGE07693.1 DUF3307 domain-containing protein [Hymenobacter fodinae]
MEQILLHLLGDYVLQNDWMAQNKTKAHWPAFVHALLYALPFTLIAPSPLAWAVIFGTHFLIDRYRLALYWIRIYNRIEVVGPFGYAESKPPYMAFWLMVIIDNTLHLTINYAAMRWL